VNFLMMHSFPVVSPFDYGKQGMICPLSSILYPPSSDLCPLTSDL
jgi:hypothetical protein